MKKIGKQYIWIVVTALCLVWTAGAAWGQGPKTIEQMRRELGLEKTEESQNAPLATMGPEDRPESDIYILFKKNQSDLSLDAAIKEIQKLGETLRGSDLVFEINGHTCSLGTEEFNLELSKKRAATVRNYLIEHFGLAPEQLIAEGYGEKYPIGNNRTESGKAKNRRVTVVNTLKSVQRKATQPSSPVVEQPPSAGDNFLYDAYVMYEREGRQRRLQAGNVLMSGDKYAITLIPEQTAYMYVFRVDERGAKDRVFPDRYIERSNPIAAQDIFTLPWSSSKDERSGKALILVVASSMELFDSDFEEVFRRLQATGVNIQTMAPEDKPRQDVIPQEKSNVMKVYQGQKKVYTWRIPFEQQ